LSLKQLVLVSKIFQYLSLAQVISSAWFFCWLLFDLLKIFDSSEYLGMLTVLVSYQTVAFEWDVF
jgi:hypothetical protein